MGCTQSKPSHNSRSSRKKSRGAKRTSAQPVNQEISSHEYKVDEPNDPAEAHELGEMYIPEEDQAIKNKIVVSDENPVTPLQSDSAQTSTENDVGVRELQHVGRPLQVPEYKSDVPRSETRTNPELDISTIVSSNTQGNGILYAHDDLNADKYNIALPTVASSTSNGRYITSAKQSPVYNGPSFPRSEVQVPEKYVDDTNKKGLEYEEYTHEAIPVYQQEDIQVHQGGQPISIAKYQVLRQSDMLGSESSKAINKPAQISKTESSHNQYQSKLNDPGVIERTEVDISRQTAEDIGSICVDARTGEYKFYQQGVLIGYVDKEEALRLSNDWPICPGTTVSTFQPEGHINIGEQPISTMNDFSITSSKSYDLDNHQVRRVQSNKLMNGHSKSNEGVSDQFLKEQVGHSIPEYRGYYM